MQIVTMLTGLCRFLTVAVLIGMLGVAATVCAGNDIRATYRADLAKAIDNQVDRDLETLLTFYKDLHRNPELSLHENNSARKIAQRLEASGYSVTGNVGGTGVVGILANGPGPTVFIRGDMDALPVTEETGLSYLSKVKAIGSNAAFGPGVGVMHACGHDIHQTCLVGTARILARMRNNWSGTVMIIAQPAEEIGAGARMMIEDGLFERFAKPDYCLALHVSADLPAGTVAYTPGWALANVDSVDITIHGRGGHGSRPHQAIDPVVTAAYVIVALQTIVSRRVDPLESAVITVGSIHAGSKHNIISNEAKMQLTVRSYTDKTRRILLDGIRDITVKTCRAMGCTRDPDVIVREDEFTPSTYNDPGLAEAAAEVFREVLGPEFVLTTKPVMGGEDFGRFPKHLNVPGFIFWLGSVDRDVFEASRRPGGPPLPSLHSSRYYPDPKPTIETGVKSMTSVALSLLKRK